MAQAAHEPERALIAHLLVVTGQVDDRRHGSRGPRDGGEGAPAGSRGDGLAARTLQQQLVPVVKVRIGGQGRWWDGRRLRHAGGGRRDPGRHADGGQRRHSHGFARACLRPCCHSDAPAVQPSLVPRTSDIGVKAHEPLGRMDYVRVIPSAAARRESRPCRPPITRSGAADRPRIDFGILATTV